MASLHKKKLAAKTVLARMKSARGEALVAPAPALVLQDAADEAEAIAQVGRDALAEPAAEIQQSVRSALEKGVVESRAAFVKAKVAADETASAFEVSLTAAKDGVSAINAKIFEALRTNADANFDFMKAVFAVKSLPDLVTLQTEFARKQVEAISGQTKDLGVLAQKAMADAVEPIKQQVSKSLKFAA
jgi:phasin